MNGVTELTRLTASKGNQENSIMLILQAISNALDTQVDKQQVRKCVDNLGRVNGRIEILYPNDQPIIPHEGW